VGLRAIAAGRGELRLGSLRAIVATGRRDLRLPSFIDLYLSRLKGRLALFLNIVSI